MPRSLPYDLVSAIVAVPIGDELRVAAPLFQLAPDPLIGTELDVVPHASAHLVADEAVIFPAFFREERHA